MKKKKQFWTYPLAVMSVLLLLISNCKKAEDDNDNNNNPPKDYDGKVYKTVTIGEQVWMAENLSTTKLNDGTNIEAVMYDNDRWSFMEKPGYGVYNNEVLYNGFVIKTGKLAPKGWHVPTDADWTTLITFLGGEEVAGGKMKEAGTSHWVDNNIGATNSSGFSGLPAGFRNGSGWYLYAGVYCFWWSINNDGGLAYISLSSSSGRVYRGSGSVAGFSVRCVKD